MQIYNIGNNSMYDENLLTIADTINKKKSAEGLQYGCPASGDSINITIEELSYLFGINDFKLINLLTFDAHELFFKSRGMLKADNTITGELIDLTVEKKFDDKNNYICGGITKYHYDSNSSMQPGMENHEFYGSLTVTTCSDSISTEKFYRFSRTKDGNLQLLTLLLTSGDRKYVKDTVLGPDGKLSYYVYLFKKSATVDEERKDREEFIFATEDSIKCTLDDYKKYKYVNPIDVRNLEFLFPEVYQKIYFRNDESGARVRQDIIVNN